MTHIDDIRARWSAANKQPPEVIERGHPQFGFDTQFEAGERGQFARHADAVFAAHAVKDMRVLLARIEELEQCIAASDGTTP